MASTAGKRLKGDARSRFEQLHDILRRRICLLDYPPGERLSEEVIAAEFGVSRTPLRRVLARLESEGLVTSVHGVGTFVTDVDIGALTQVYGLRMELAELVGKLDPAPPDDTLRETFRRLADEGAALAAAPDPRRFAELNMAFFEALMRLTSNEPLREISERLYFQTTRIWLQSVSRLSLATEAEVFAREVADIAAAVEADDLTAAAHIRRAHVSMSFRRLRALGDGA